MNDPVREVESKPLTDVQKFLRDNPEFAQVIARFSTLSDAADVLSQLGHVPTSAYVREVGHQVLRDAGMQEPFVQAMIASRKEFVNPFKDD